MTQVSRVWANGVKTQRPKVLWKARDAQWAPAWLRVWHQTLEAAIWFSLGWNSKGSWRNSERGSSAGLGGPTTARHFCGYPDACLLSSWGHHGTQAQPLLVMCSNNRADYPIIQLWEVISIKEWREKKEKIHPVTHVENVPFVFLEKLGTKSLSWDLPSLHCHIFPTRTRFLFRKVSQTAGLEAEGREPRFMATFYILYLRRFSLWNQYLPLCSHLTRQKLAGKVAGTVSSQGPQKTAVGQGGAGWVLEDA